jgi:hypothetical protein
LARHLIPAYRAGRHFSQAANSGTDKTEVGQFVVINPDIINVVVFLLEFLQTKCDILCVKMTELGKPQSTSGENNA